MAEIHPKFKHLFEFRLPFVSGVVFNYLIRTDVRNPTVAGSKDFKENEMSAVTFNAMAPQSSVNQGLSKSEWLTNPSGVLTRRGRLARTLVILSLTVVMAAGFAAKSGAGDQVAGAVSYLSVVVPAGATLWSVAAAYSTGDIQAMVEQIREVNNLSGYGVAAGQRLRVPTK